MSSYQTIKLTRFGPKDDPCPQHAWPMTVVAEGINMPSEIFVYRVEHPDLQGDTFRCVSAVNDLYEFPSIRSPYQNDENWIPYYRRSQVELIFRNASDAEHVWKRIQRDVDDLIDNYNSTLNMQIVGIYENSTDPNHTTIDELPTMNLQQLIQLEYQPNGTADFDTANNQIITAPFLNDIRGWLPISELPGNFLEPAPSNAKFFYNIQKHTDLVTMFPLEEPISKHLVFYEGNKLKEGLHYKITKDTIYWLDFDYGKYSEYGIVGNAPWNPDYVDKQNVGSDPIDMSIQIFKSE